MGSYVKVINGIVVQGIVADQDFIDTLVDKDFWVQTSYNIRGGVYYDPQTNEPVSDQSIIELEPGRKRKNFASVGYTYDKERDAFIPPIPYPSWKLNEKTCLWEAPIPKPQDNKRYIWNEAQQEWTYTGWYLQDGEWQQETIGE
jgi:hypothetical protein